MKRLFIYVFALSATLVSAQIDKEKLALDISKADAANTEQIKAFIWKRYSTAKVNDEVKVTVITEFSFDEKGEIKTTQVGGETSEKQKPGLRGKIQEGAVEDKMEYLQKALELSLAYTYMSKGQLLDFFEKATVTEKDGFVQATGGNVYVAGDSLTILVDAKTNLFLNKKCSSLMGKDPIDGEIKYEYLSTGINHGATTVLNMPGQKAKIDAQNKDYSQQVN